MSASVDWSDLATLGMRVEAISIWPGPATPASARRFSPFRGASGRRTPFSTTVSDLTREMKAIGARDPVLQLALRDHDIRRDGFPRADARPAHPGIILTFVARNVRGTPRLSYPVDTFTEWQDNLRAVALGMEAQRKLKRYGIAEYDQQYAGYRSLPAPSSQTSTEARSVLLGFAGWSNMPADVGYKQLFRAAAKAANNLEDSEGSMNAVMNAGRTLGVIT